MDVFFCFFICQSEGVKQTMWIIHKLKKAAFIYAIMYILEIVLFYMKQVPHGYYNNIQYIKY